MAFSSYGGRGPRKRGRPPAAATPEGRARGAGVASGSITWALMVIDDRPLRAAAWSEFHAVRKRLEKAGRDLERHEKIDAPGYNSWLSQSLPVLLSDIRQLILEVRRKSIDVEQVEMMAAFSGRPAAKVWRAFLDGTHEFAPEPPPPPPATDGEELDEADEHAPGAKRADRTGEARSPWDDLEDDRDAFDALFGEGFSSRGGGDLEGENAAQLAGQNARDIYRRLVQHLHPDRGGEWTPARESLWHEVQRAWAARDVDWLSRLEVQWETAHETITQHSPLSRLRAAIEEVHAARRDLERKLRGYRANYAWRFSLTPHRRELLHEKVARRMEEDRETLRSQLAYLNERIAAWERGGKAPRSRGLKRS